MKYNNSNVKGNLSTNETNNWRKVFQINNEKAFQELKAFLSVEEIEGFGKQVNRGKIAELYLQNSLGLKPVFDKISDYDFIYQNKKVQFKYLGQNSAPSVSELKRFEDESIVKFTNRVMKHYSNCDLFVISLENHITHINWTDCIILTPKEFMMVLRGHDKNVKVDSKLRLRKTVVRRVLGL